MAMYIVKLFYDFPFQIVEHDPKSKLIEGRRTSSVVMAEYTDERWKAVQEWNKRVKDHQDFLRAFSQKAKRFGFK